MYKIATIVGARPQFIKAATVSRAVRSDPRVEEILIHTGQHYDPGMSSIFFEELGIPEPHINLGIGSLPPGEQVGRMVIAIEEVLLKERPNIVLVYGDTNSTLAGAIAAVKAVFPLAHVEAGLRSYNRAMPEEINRVLTDHSSEILFSPTDTATSNLIKENISKEKIFQVGDVMFDAVQFYSSWITADSQMLEALKISKQGYILATIHRSENTDDSQRLAAIWQAMNSISKEIPVIVPLHPRTRLALQKLNLLEQRNSALHVVNSVGYLEMTLLEKHARLIVTDSGGVQKEAFFLGVTCITLRAESEWTELVDSGWNQLVNPLSASEVFESIHQQLVSPSIPQSPQKSWFGNGEAAKKILEIILLGS